MTSSEWLETDGHGGFASGSSSLIPTRRYHSLLVTSLSPPTHRYSLLNNVEVFLDFEGHHLPLSALSYSKETVAPGGIEHLSRFQNDPWPTYTFSIPPGITITQEIVMVKKRPLVILTWRVENLPSVAKLTVRPLLTARDYHSLHRHNTHFNFDAVAQNGVLSWRPYEDTPALHCVTASSYIPSPQWYYNVWYKEDEARGYQSTEDFASPGYFEWDFHGKSGEIHFIFSAEPFPEGARVLQLPVNFAKSLLDKELSRRNTFRSHLHKAADDFIVKRGNGKSIVAGYPWFTDWGRDTFISLRGLCLTTERMEDASQIIELWGATLSRGMIPNVFPDRDNVPLYNSVDAALWFVISSYEFIRRGARSTPLNDKIFRWIETILQSYIDGTRFGIKVDKDGLVQCGLKGTQLTWMDAKYGDNVFTPRVGKPVEISALWINALRIGGEISDKWLPLYEEALVSFQELFWNSGRKMLYDVIDVNHQPGLRDERIRPNQLFAVGGLPLQLLDSAYAKAVVDAVESHLLTPRGLRTLSPESNEYRAHYTGGTYERDSAYHQGTAWVWLMGAFVEAWVRVRGGTAAAKEEASQRFLAPLIAEAENGHLPEIADGNPPFTWRGSPFQAWSVAEILRMKELLS